MNFRFIVAHFRQMRNADFGMRNFDLFTAERAEVSEKFFKKLLRILILYSASSASSAVNDQISALGTQHSPFDNRPLEK